MMLFFGFGQRNSPPLKGSKPDGVPGVAHEVSEDWCPGEDLNLHTLAGTSS